MFGYIKIITVTIKSVQIALLLGIVSKCVSLNYWEGRFFDVLNFFVRAFKRIKLVDIGSKNKIQWKIEWEQFQIFLF